MQNQLDQLKKIFLTSNSEFAIRPFIKTFRSEYDIKSAQDLVVAIEFNNYWSQYNQRLQDSEQMLGLLKLVATFIRRLLCNGEVDVQKDSFNQTIVRWKSIKSLPEFEADMKLPFWKPVFSNDVNSMLYLNVESMMSLYFNDGSVIQTYGDNKEQFQNFVGHKIGFLKHKHISNEILFKDSSILAIL